MTTQPLPEEARSQVSKPVSKVPRIQFLKNLKIGSKVTIGFGILVALTFLSAGVSYLGSGRATDKINLTDDVRVPMALAAVRAQVSLLQMQADVRGYLALGDQEYRDSYDQSNQAFNAALDELDHLLTLNPDPENYRRLEELRIAYEQWSEWPEKLFELRDDKVDREPAYRLLATEGILFAGNALLKTNSLIEEQAQAEPSADNLILLQDMAKFQGNFAALLSALRNYVTTRNRIFRQYEYEANLTANENTWERLQSKRDMLNLNQRKLLDEIAQNRETFLNYPNRLFEIVEGDRYREDLYLFRTEVVPLAERMRQLLNEMTADQQTLLTTELASGRQDLTNANQLILAGGVIALIVGLVMTYLARETIAGPVRRLTSVAEQIRAGDLEAQARVESGDEIGILAETFNNMTGQLRQTLMQVRKEKKRADDLLEVVIPIGVELSSEKDFNRLLEKMLLEAKVFCHAEAGILYLKEGDRLKFVIVRNDKLDIAMGGTVDRDVTFSRLPVVLPVYDDETTREDKRQSIAAHAAGTGTTINIPDAYEKEVLNTYGSGVVDEKSNYYSIAYLPGLLKDSADQVLCVLQLINAQDPETEQIIPFDQNLQRMMESFSSLAVAALEAYIREQSLKEQIQQLRIEIDEVKRQKQVSEIVETDFFQDLQAKARRMRSRRRTQDAPSDEVP
jgi:CHASE3 domain sensor protein